jgi:hypothetical protein
LNKKIRTYLILLAFLSHFITKAQTSDSLRFGNSSNHGNISLTGGQIFLVDKDYSSNSLLPINSIGVDFESTFDITAGSFYFDSRFSLHFFIPNDYEYSNNNISLSGYKASILPVGLDLFSNNKKLDLITSIGFSFGRFKHSNKYSNNETPEFKNNFSLIELSIQPRYVTKYLTFSIRPFYGYDLSSGSWKGDNSLNDKPEITKFSLYGIYASIGWTWY